MKNPDNIYFFQKAKSFKEVDSSAANGQPLRRKAGREEREGGGRKSISSLS